MVTPLAIADWSAQLTPRLASDWHVWQSAASVQDRPIRLYGSQPNPSDTVDCLLMAAIHGDELESFHLMADLMATPMATWPEALGITWPGEHPVVGIIPVVNPDGLAAYTRTNAHSIDLNRHFPTQDWASLEAGTPYFSGHAPASEPEVQFLVSILDRYPPKRIVTVHTPYRVINYDGPALALAQAMAQWNHFDVVADIGYPTPGSFGTYTGIERHIPVITLELPENEAYTPQEAQQNRLALMQAVFYAGE